MMAETRWFEVVSEPMGEVIPITDDGQGPVEYGCDVALVEAENRKEARWKAYRLWREMRRRPSDFKLQRWQVPKWPQVAADDGLHPLHGMKAEPVTPSEDETIEEWIGAFHPYVLGAPSDAPEEG